MEKKTQLIFDFFGELEKCDVSTEFCNYCTIYSGCLNTGIARCHFGSQLLPNPTAFSPAHPTVKKSGTGPPAPLSSPTKIPLATLKQRATHSFYPNGEFIFDFFGESEKCDESCCFQAPLLKWNGVMGEPFVM